MNWRQLAVARRHPASVLEMGAGRRLVVAAVLVALIWAVVVWAA